MKAVVLYTPGGPENLKIEIRPVPEPNKDQVLVRVKAFGLKQVGTNDTKGLFTKRFIASYTGH